MLPVEALRSDPRLVTLAGLASDFDDTLTWHGVLEPDALRALVKLCDSGLPCVVATGRPVGWAEVLLRTLPVRAVVAENGGVFVLREGRALRVAFLHDAATRRAHDEKLREATATLMQKLPALRPVTELTKRYTDFAFDVGEDARIDPALLSEAVITAHELGLYTVVSSVHLHLSAHRPDKFAGLQACARALGFDAHTLASQWAYVGDSANDAAPFAAMELTVGVANVRDALERLPVPPRYVTSMPGGGGFAELGALLLAAKGLAP